MAKITKKEAEEHKKRAHAIYDKIGKVYCPVVKDDVYFNAQGKYHLRYEVTGVERTLEEQCYKLRLVKHVEEIVKNATVIHETRLEKAPIRRKKKNGQKVIKDVIYSAIVQVVKTPQSSKKIKVILRKVGNGRTIFWSVMKLK